MHFSFPHDYIAGSSNFCKHKGVKTAFVVVLVSLFLGAQSARAASPHLAPAPSGMSQQQIDSYNQALTQMRAGDYQHACEKFEAICKQLPAFSDAHEMYAVALMQLGKFEPSLAEFQKAATIAPDRPILLLNMGSLYRQLGQQDKALEQFTRLLRLYPKDEHTALVRDMVDAIRTEQSRSKGVANSKGQDNYLEESMQLGAARWTQAQMPVSVFVGTALGLKGYKEQYPDMLKEAFTTWAAASAGKLSFKFTSDADTALIVCNWVDDPSKLADSSEGGEATPTRLTSGGFGKSKITLITFRPNAPPLTDDIVRYTALHEVGHLCGLLGHSSQPGDVMFAVVPATPSPILSERDKKTLFDLYAAPDSVITDHPLVLKDAGFIGHDSNPKNRAIKLNASAVQESQAGNYEKAIALYQEALKLAPDMDFIPANLGGAYTAIANKELKALDLIAAEKHLNIAVDYYRKAGRNDIAAQHCKILMQIAERSGKEADAHKYEALKRQLEAQK